MGPNHSDFSKAFRSGTVFDTRESVISIEVIDAGSIALPSGKLCACDPLQLHTISEAAAFQKPVPRGAYPVSLSLAHIDFHGEANAAFVAASRVTFSGAPAIRYEIAGRKGQRAKAINAGKVSAGYEVDSGYGCFFDPAFLADIQDEYRLLLNVLDESESHANATFATKGAGHKIITFLAGVGDGIFSSYWGYDIDGRLVSLTTDFEILFTNEPIQVSAAVPPQMPLRVENPQLRNLGIEIEVLVPVCAVTFSAHCSWFTLENANGIGIAHHLAHIGRTDTGLQRMLLLAPASCLGEARLSFTVTGPNRSHSRVVIPRIAEFRGPLEHSQLADDEAVLLVESHDESEAAISDAFVSIRAGRDLKIRSLVLVDGPGRPAISTELHAEKSADIHIFKFDGQKSLRSKHLQVEVDGPRRPL